MTWQVWQVVPYRRAKAGIAWAVEVDPRTTAAIRSVANRYERMRYLPSLICRLVGAPAVTVTSRDESGSFSPQVLSVYFPGGTFGIVNFPSSPVTAKNGLSTTTTTPSISGCTLQSWR